MERHGIMQGRLGRLVAGAVPVAGAALVAGLVMPRGPASTLEAIASILAGLGVGLVAGFAWRWSCPGFVDT